MKIEGLLGASSRDTGRTTEEPARQDRTRGRGRTSVEPGRTGPEGRGGEERSRGGQESRKHQELSASVYARGSQKRRAV